ncbi:hypothetical protein LIG30_1793 [Burkholderia sp. lig30]|uniref:hypothetical protein n=1 Tax=Burkholderia sp. lig30 TaxID=1192124 RepID=UPI000460B77E|nr:hypothetical protein [Burkholderia sp. lig30]KDB09181.1 hypothetical protein LIG30_1793 [Burkholderia sp. lig30]
METVHELVMLVPGMARSERERYATRLSDGIEGFLETHRESVQSFRRRSDSSGRAQFDIRLCNGQQKLVDVVEIFWNDLRPPLEKSWIPFLGYSLVRYWLSLKQWKAIPKTSRPLQRAFCVGTCFLFVWYVLTLLAILHFTQLLSLFLPTHTESPIGWLWVGATGLLATGFVTSNIDASYAAFCYLKNREGFCDRVRRRVINAFREIGPQFANYQSITLLAHSFGSVVAVDAIAWIMAEPDPASLLRAFKFVTAGSPLEFVMSREPAYEKRIRQCVASTLVENWIDFYALTDSLCSKVPFEAERKRSHAGINLGYTEIEASLGFAHDYYFEHDEVLKAILNL